LNYFTENITKENIEKDLNDLLKKIKKDKKYYISTKDIILIESLKSDGVQVLKKYEDFYQIDDSNMPADIQFLIDNDEIGLVLLRLVEVIGQDEIQNIGSETLYFIISALNQLDIDPLRNKILLKVLPLKVKKYN
jgi:biotin operon repressor